MASDKHAHYLQHYLEQRFGVEMGPSGNGNEPKDPHLAEQKLLEKHLSRKTSHLISRFHEDFYLPAPPTINRTDLEKEIENYYLTHEYTGIDLKKTHRGMQAFLKHDYAVAVTSTPYNHPKRFRVSVEACRLESRKKT